MTGNDMSQVVDKVAEKIGVAADKLALITKATVEQVALRGEVFCLFLGGLAIILLGLTTLFAKRAFAVRDDEGRRTAFIGLSIVSGVLVFGFACAAFVHLGHWLAPIPTLLGK